MILSNITPRMSLRGTIFRGGGGGGVTSYTQLNDKPQINGVTIEDNHDGHYYGLANQSDILIEGYNQVPGESIYRLHDVTIEGRNYTVAYIPFVGTDGVDDGKVGLVPAPTASDENKVLFGDGSWKGILYNQTSLYHGTTQTLSMALSDSLDNYDAIIIIAKWSVGGAYYGYINTIPTSLIDNTYSINTGGEGRYNYINASDRDHVNIDTSGGWDGDSIITDIIGVKYN